jgi:DNA-binding beta-propeller fold protein YncE
VDPRTGNLWVANTRSHDLRVYDADQRYLFTVGDGEDSIDAGSFRWPLDIDFAGRSAFITDYIGHRLKRVRTIDGRERWSVKSRAVHGVAVDREARRVYAVGPGRDRVFVHRLRDGKRLRSFGTSGTGRGQLSSPWDIDLLEGRLYVSDAARDKILAFATDGDFLGEFGSAGSGPGQLRSPSGLAHDGEGRLYVADAGNYRVQVFRPGRAAAGDGRPPQVGITAPVDGVTVPRGRVELTGTAVDRDGVGMVEVTVEDSTTGEAWHAPSSSWRRSGSSATAALSGADPTRQAFRWVLTVIQPGHRYVARFRAYDADGTSASSPLPAVRFTVQ